MQEKYIPLYKELYEANDSNGMYRASARLAVRLAQDAVDSVAITPISAPVIIAACKLVIKVISETPAIADDGLDAAADDLFNVVTKFTTVYSGTKRNESFEEMMK